MNLGHGRAGHLPDYSYICYAYLPAWNGYKEVVKDNPAKEYGNSEDHGIREPTCRDTTTWNEKV